MNGHAVHPRKEIWAKRGGKPTSSYLNITLRMQELPLLVRFRWSMRLIMSGRKRGVGHQPGPKTVGETVDNGLDETRIRVVAQQLVKDRNINGGDDPEKGEDERTELKQQKSEIQREADGATGHREVWKVR